MERLGADAGERFARSVLHHIGASPNPELLIMAAMGCLNQDRPFKLGPIRSTKRFDMI
jgi:hypothetical protein